MTGPDHAGPPSADDALAAYDVLEGPVDPALQGVVDLAALTCEVAHAAVNLITRDHQHQVAVAGLDPSVCSREDSMCAAVLEQPSLVVSPDARLDARFAGNPFVTGLLASVRFYASAPLVTPDGTAIGRLCIFDDEPREMTLRREAVLTGLAARVVDVLELGLRTRQLERSLEELTSTRDELRRSNELLSLFAGQVSHDLRSPLTAIMANAELLALEPVVQQDPEVVRLAEASLAAGQRMAAMIGSILELAAVDARPDLTTIDLDAVLVDVLEDLAPVIEQRRARVRRECLPTVRADRSQVYSVLLNLLSNAVKYVPPSTRPEVQVSADRVGDQCRIEVSDNGRGIPVAEREVVFELYRRGSSAVDGVGIGLATARRAVEAHGGRIGIADRPGGGATVWFTLPA